VRWRAARQGSYTPLRQGKAGERRTGGARDGRRHQDMRVPGLRWAREAWALRHRPWRRCFRDHNVRVRPYGPDIWTRAACGEAHARQAQRGAEVGDGSDFPVGISRAISWILSQVKIG
jgi:hypothetical protein